MALRDTRANQLDKFIEDNLLPDTPFRTQVREAVDIICTFLKERCFRGAAHPVRVSKVVKGGSSGKGTTLRDRSDADLVVFLTNLKSFQEQLLHRGEFIQEITRQLEACQREKRFKVKFEIHNSPRANPRALSFMLTSPQLDQGVEFDVLPAFDALGQLTRGYRPDPKVYIQLIEECESLGKEGEFSPCFTELQRAFLRDRPTKLKSLIRLVKHWYQECKRRNGKEGALPPQYALELLTVYAWERGSGSPEFNTAQGFRTVLELVRKHQDLCIYWENYYSLENPIIGRYLKKQLGKPRPVILDPADPTGNVAGRDPGSWWLLAQEAAIWLRYPCLTECNGSPVSTWEVQPRLRAELLLSKETKLTAAQSPAAGETEAKRLCQPALPAAGSPARSIVMALRDTRANQLDKFIEDNLLPDTPFRTQVREAVDIICTFLKERCFRGAAHPVRVSKVVKGGSSGKGTTLRGRSDADLVVFLTNLKSFREQLRRRGEFIQEITRQLEACHREKKFKVMFKIHNRHMANPRALSFALTSPQLDQGVEFDVLPAFDALGQLTRGYRPDPKVYIQLIEECESLGKEGEFSPCFTELQRAFLRDRPTKLKSLIRLVKHWYQECKQQLGKPLPPQYALELLTVYAWEQGSGKTEFNTAQGFRTVLELVRKHQDLCIYWENYYSLENPIIGCYLKKQLGKLRPVILDPADPTGNIGGGDPRSWQRLAEEATAWLSYPCLKKWDGSPVDSWHVPPRKDSYWTHEACDDCQHWEFSPRPITLQGGRPPLEEENWSCVIL
ncbi:LOW QUALITY PROTEIN: 2'-5'-oligoadenylate synthase 1 [Camelus ferus]|uniref:2'-5' oligoadenylate synthase n=1 Tax=Camelus ferus TaxID=419612 RepID=A0A8B8SD19_CAMFR|nr:LOW QUALITY PROTEIN: 2'-5'-oligoadenylate synthase 1 [Camelus ferus]